MIRRALGLLVIALALGGCERGMHDMYDQPKYKSLAPSPLFADDNSARTPPPGSVASAAGDVADSSGGRRGHLAAVAPIGPALPLDGQGRNLAQGDAGARNETSPLPVTMALLQRGQQRYGIYCAVCHGDAGEGDGMIVRRGFPAPPSYHSERLRNAPVEHAGRIRKELADEMAGKEYEKFKAAQQAIEKEESLNRLEADLKKIGKRPK